MKNFLKIAFASLMVMVLGLGMGQAADHAKKVTTAYRQYETELKNQDVDEIKKSLKSLEKVCDKECTRFTCKDSSLQEVCYLHCPAQKIKNCLKVKGYTPSNPVKYDSNGIPKQKTKKSKVKIVEEEDDDESDEY